MRRRAFLFSVLASIAFATIPRLAHARTVFTLDINRAPLFVYVDAFANTWTPLRRFYRSTP